MVYDYFGDNSVILRCVGGNSDGNVFLRTIIALYERLSTILTSKYCTVTKPSVVLCFRIYFTREYRIK